MGTLGGTIGTMDTHTHPYFIPNGDSARETATLLVGTADEFGIDQHDIQATNGGFNVTEALAKAVYGDDFVAQDPDEADSETTPEPEPEPEPAPEEPDAAVASDEVATLNDGTEADSTEATTDESAQKTGRRKSSTTSGNRAG